MHVRNFFAKFKAALTNAEFTLIKSRANSYGYEVNAKVDPPATQIVTENVFKTGFGKNALLSYIFYPFSGSIQNNHSNNSECYTIAELLRELGYNVDVINWNNITFLPERNYDVVIDNHDNLSRLATYFTGNTKKIFHATNAHWLYQNSVEYARYEEFFAKTGMAIKPPRLMPPGNSVAYADVISMFGNNFTKSTYGVYGHKVHHLPMSVTTTPGLTQDKNYSLAKKKFFWLNSHGALLKGLDIVIDAFALMPALELHVCINPERDSEFVTYISKQLSEAPNIIMEGWVDTSSPAFDKLVTDCAWIINTSFSEGGGGSTLNCMAKGLVPVVSRSASITLPGKTGFYLENNNAASLVALLKTIVDLPDDDLKEMSGNAYNFISENHTLENFRSRYKEFLVKVLQPEIINYA